MTLKLVYLPRSIKLHIINDHTINFNIVKIPLSKTQKLPHTRQPIILSNINHPLIIDLQNYILLHQSQQALMPCHKFDPCFVASILSKLVLRHPYFEQIIWNQVDSPLLVRL